MGTRNTKIINILAKNVIDTFLETAKSFMLKIFREALEVKYSQTNAAITANMYLNQTSHHLFHSKAPIIYNQKTIAISINITKQHIH